MDRKLIEEIRMEILDDRVVEILKNKTPAERLQIGFKMWTSARQLLLSQIKQTHPDWSQQEIEQEAARRILHEEYDPKLDIRSFL